MKERLILKLLHTLPVLWLTVLLALPGTAVAFWPCGTMTPVSIDSGLRRWWTDTLEVTAITHLGRHGARFLSSEKKVADLEKELLLARKDGTITAKGERALELLDTVRRHTAGNWGMLTPLGIDEEREIGRQLAGLAPGLMHSSRADAISTTVPRVVESMYSLCFTLARNSSDLSIKTEDSREYDPLLRFFDTDSVYSHYLADGAWKGEYNRYVEANVPVTPALSLVGAQNDAARLRKITMDMYAVMQGMPAAGLDIPYSEWFTDSQMQRCAAVSNMRHWLQRCANPISGIPARAAIPLMERLLKETREPGVHLNFGHAETLLPVLSLMGLADDGNASDIVPLGAYMVVFSLRGPSGERYVALMLNGRPISLKDGERVMTQSSFEEIIGARINLFSR